VTAFHSPAVEVRYIFETDFVRVQLRGCPSLGEFLAVLQSVGSDSQRWRQDLVMIDLREVEPVYSFTDQFTIGEEVGRSLKHLRRFASVVPTSRITRVSERAANHRGANVRVFTSEAEAVAWLRNA
jgi:hypothetical protein